MVVKEGHGRDLIIAVAVVGVILLGLYLYTGNWPPPVVVESNSMMHVNQQEYQGNFGSTRASDVPYGRLGTIDPGDLVLVKKMDTAEDVETFADGSDEHYGMPGEVIVYYRFGDRAATPIIHRAMTYVERTTTSSGEPRYEVRWSDEWEERGSCSTRDDGQRVCVFGSEGITISELRLNNKDFQHSGFITKGDNVVGNQAPDQVLGIMSQPVKMEWVQGVARGELPWFGLIKLMLTDPANKNPEVQDHPYYWSIGKMTAPKDTWVMLVVGLAAVALAPLGADLAMQYGKRFYDERRGHTAPPPREDEGPPSTPPAPAREEEGEGDGAEAGPRVGIDLE